MTWIGYKVLGIRCRVWLVVDNHHLDHAGLPHVVIVAVHVVIFDKLWVGGCGGCGGP